MVKMLFTKKIVLGILVTLVLLTAVGINYAVGVDGPVVKELSLQEALDLAVKNNPDIELADLAVKRAQVECDGAKDVADDLEINVVNTYQTGIMKWVTPKAKEMTLILAQKGQDVTEKSLMSGVEKAYYDVLSAERTMEIKRENLKLAQDRLKIGQTGYKIGTKAKVDLNTDEASVASGQAEVAGAENSYRTAVMELNRMIGLDLDTLLKLTTKFSVEKTGSSIILEDTIKGALADNLEILTVKETQALSQVQFDVARKFYTGGVTVYDTAQIDAKTAELKVKQKELAITSTIKKSYLTLFYLEKSIDWRTKEIEKAQENARIFLLKYGAGLATSLDVKKAAIDLEQAKENLSGDIYKYNILKSLFKYNLFVAD
ncbi:MAG: hypothetical protein CVV03_10525 [Firmicutes bacterium HGW-Firmicutes-8]|nr:MAG: hypothetical protein CVV03_10525 [Firmicutes bacterium HGW-Firmicutes-8]